MAQVIEKVFCPSCGAPVKFLEGRDDTFCIHCGHQLFKEDTNLELKLKHEEEIGKQEIQKLEQKKEMASDKQITILFILMFVMAISFLLFGLFM